MPRLEQIADDHAIPGTRLRTRLLGRDLATVTGVRFSGSGVAAELAGVPGDDAIEIAITVAGDALPGPRSLELSFVTDGRAQRRAQGVQFHVRPLTSFGDISGIGSHLI